jgi:betaine reductase
MDKPVTILHFMNQFFGGIGGEDKADTAPEFRAGPVGPGVALAKHLGDRATIVGTLICGDNYFIEHQEEAVARLLELAEACPADVLVAGPAFNSGRYGSACGEMALAWQGKGRSAVTAMNVNNPGVELFRSQTYVLETGATAASMGDVIPRLADFAIKLANGAEIGSADTEGYFSRGVRKNLRVDQGAPARAVGMLLEKLAGRPFQTELPVPAFSNVTPAPPVEDLSGALVALITESGLVPMGNPDRLETWNASKWLKYPIGGLDDLRPGDYEAWHGGCDTAGTNERPNRTLPLDAARLLERDGTINRLYDHYYVTTGNMANIETMSRIGAEVAEDMKSQGVQAAILTAT